MLSEHCIPMEQYRNHFELQSWFKCNYLRHLSGEESNTKSITFINHDIMTESASRQGKSNVFLLPRSCFYLFIYFLRFFDLDFVSVRIQRKK